MAGKLRKDKGHGSPVPTGGTDARATRKGRVVRKDGRVKTTQLLPLAMVNELAAVAGSQGKEHSEVVADALNAYLPRFVVVKAMRRAGEEAGPGQGEAAAGAGQGPGVDPPRGL